MKKIIFLFICAFLLTGCQMDYKLEFKNDKINEIIIGEFEGDIIELAKEIDGDSLYFEKELAEENIYALTDSEAFYEKEIVVKDNKSIATLKYEYDYESFQKSYLIDRCFDDYYFIDDEEYYYINLTGEFSCFHNDDIQIKVTSDKKVISHNADKYKDGVYIWDLKLAEDQHDIIFQISKTISAEEKFVENGFNIFPIIGHILFAILIFMIFIIKKRFNKDE